MGITITTMKDKEALKMSKYTLTERHYVTLDGSRLAKTGEPCKLLGGVGKSIPMAEAQRLGLAEKEPAPVAEIPTETPKAEIPAEDKAEAPAEDKAVAGPKKKKGK